MSRYSGRKLPLAVLVSATLAMGACSSSDDDDDAPIVGDGTTVGDTDVDVGDDGTGGIDGDDGIDGTDGDGVAGPGSDIDIGADGVVQFGLVRVRQPDLRDDGDGDDGDLYASFVRFDAALPADRLGESFQPAADTCTVESDDDDSDDDLFPGAIGRPFEFVSAGESIVFTSEAGTWVTLPRRQEPRFIGYRPESRPLPTPFPNGLVVDVPGDAFLAFSAVPIVDVEPLRVLEPANDDGVSAGTTFRWEAASSDGARVEIELEFDEDDTGLDSDLEVRCSAVDDGEFALPADVLARVPQGATGDLDMDRKGLSAVREGESVLFVESEAAGGL